MLTRDGARARHEIRCPVCDAPCDPRPLETYDAAQAAAHFCPPGRDADRYARLERVVERLWDGGNATIHRCARCGFGFAMPFVGGDEAFYAILHEQYGYPAWRWDYDVALEALHGSRGGRALDVGAGTGNFLRSLGPAWSTHAVEGSETTRAVLRRAGIGVFPSLDAAVAEGAGSFAVVTMFQVLEHIADFRPVIRGCTELLAPGGTLVITVPDCDAMLRQPELTGEHDMPPNHVGKWTPRSLALALEEAGLTPTRTVQEPASWRKAASQVYGRVRTDAQRPGTAAALAYRVRNRKVRAPLLALVGATTLPRLLPRWQELRAGGAFATIATHRG